jgi:hypothetical protein
MAKKYKAKISKDLVIQDEMPIFPANRNGSLQKTNRPSKRKKDLNKLGYLVRMGLVKNIR